ncbi:MAG: hypothetical protein BWY01_01704 [Synergistetes bacterium ADurb.Bin155]|jgi:hypothetical protein|nr:hypothetical protein [Synergistales bacterium]NMD17523.1 hypothetical protein [Synergistaceae bacterium]OQB44693.1 MAG: hypothetical protein BWY01_01704 [Synergistetes bacterium ADurb.Bin155]MBP8996636.1 hypothetical protein [Synergistales bacterium]HOC81961.1 hypothetical protein [Synergistales bacterium]
MKPRQILVNLAIITLMAVVAFISYMNGKTSMIYVENLPFETEAATYPAFEAATVGMEGGPPPIFLEEGDRDVLTVVGRSHVLLIEELDSNDNVVNTYRVDFKNSELKGKVVNIVPLAHGKLPGWSYPLD